MPSVELGSGMHKLLELSFSEPLDQVLSLYLKWSEDTLKWKEKYLHAEDLAKLKECHDKAVPMWEAYFRTYCGGGLKPATLQVLKTEHKFILELESVYVPGVIDQIALIENPWYKSDAPSAVLPGSPEILAVLDYKTTSLELETYYKSMLKSAQGPIYLKWARSASFAEDFPDIAAKYGRPEAVMVDMISTPAIRQKKTETWPQFLDRYREELLSDPSSSFVRRVFQPTEANIRGTLQGFEMDAQDCDRYFHAGHWPKNDKNCLDISGKICEYSDECDGETECCGVVPPSRNPLVQLEGINGDQDTADE